MKRIIFGTTVYSRLIRRYIEDDTSDEILAYTVERDYLCQESFDGLPLVDFDRLGELFDMSEASVLITCGYHNMNDIRKKIFQRCEDKKYMIGDFIHSSAGVKGVSFGRGNIVMPEARFHPFITVGDANIFGEACMIEQETSISSFNFVGPKTFIGSFVTIGNNNDFGIGAIVSDRKKIGNYNLIGSGSVLNKDIDEFNLVSPQPSRVQKSKKRLLDILVNSV